MTDRLQEAKDLLAATERDFIRGWRAQNEKQRDLLAWAVGEVERLRDEMRLARALSEAVDAYEEEDDEATCFALYDAIPKANAAFMRAHYSGTGKPGTRVNRG